MLMTNARTKDLGFWDETTSFILVESSLSTYEFGAKVCKGLSAQHDMVFIFDPDDSSACYFGAVAHAGVLKSFFPDLKKLP